MLLFAFLCRANASGGAIAVLGSGQLMHWRMSHVALHDNHAKGPGGAVALTVTIEGALCEHCSLQNNHAGSLGGAVYSVSRKLCMQKANKVRMYKRTHFVPHKTNKLAIFMCITPNAHL